MVLLKTILALSRCISLADCDLWWCPAGDEDSLRVSEALGDRVAIETWEYAAKKIVDSLSKL